MGSFLVSWRLGAKSYETLGASRGMLCGLIQRGDS